MLLVWDRRNDAGPRRALALVKQIMGDARLRAHVMPLLRPLGRLRSDYEKIGQRARGNMVHGGLSEYGEAPPAVRLPVSELWMQVSPFAVGEAWDLLRGWVGATGEGWALGDLYGAPENCWAPFGADLEGALQNYPLRVPGLPADQYAWAMKVVWYRATEVICRRLLAGSSPCLLAPGQDQAFIANLLHEMLGDTDLSDYGVCKASVSVAPWSSPVSHLTAFALNAVTVMDGDTYCLEQYWKWRGATHPYMCPSLEEYLDCVRRAGVP